MKPGVVNVNLMNRLGLYIVLLLTAVGCKDYGTSQGDVGSQSDSSSISVSCTDGVFATKGAIIDEATFDQMELYAYKTTQKDWSKVTSSDDIEQFMFSQMVEKKNGSWVYSPVKYWPLNTDEYISFFAFAPYGEINYSSDPTTNLPVYDYTMSQNASENDDLLVASPHYDCTSENSSSGIELEFDHALTRLSLLAAVSNDSSTNLAAGEVNIRYNINGITFFGLYSTAEMTFDDNEQWAWDLNDAEGDPTIDYTATQGKTLYAYDDDKAYLTQTAKSIMASDYTAIFALPQYVSRATLQVRIRKEYDSVEILDAVPESGYYEKFAVDGQTYYIEKDSDGEYIVKVPDLELIYATADDIQIPTPDANEGYWNAGEWLNLVFKFDSDNLTAYETPMTLSSSVYDWNEVDVNAEIHPNIYIYSSDNNVDMQTDADGNYGEFTICTNYDYNLRVPHHREELDGSITSSRGFLFYSDDFTAWSTNSVGTYLGYQIFVPTLLDKSGKEVVYVTNKNYVGSMNTQAYDIVYGSNGYAYIYNEATALYRLLYFDPVSGVITPFDYIDDGVYYEIDLTDFEEDNTVSFKIKPSDNYSFDFSVRKSTRLAEGLYTSSEISSGDSSYGVNKEDEDPVYILRLSVETAHLDENGQFNDVIGVEMISNGGGMISQLFPVTLTDNTGAN